MADVAHVVGVSQQTVSRVLNDSGAVSPATRQKVLDAIGQLGYRRNLAARALVTRRSGSIGVITSDVLNFGPSSTLAAVEAAARDQDLNLSLVILRQPSRQELLATLQVLGDQHVEAVVVIAGGSGTTHGEILSRCAVPVVVVQGDTRSGVMTAAVDHAKGARLATQHLLDLGHDNVLHVAGPPGWLESRTRAQGWRSALRQAGRPVPPLQWRGDWSALSGYEIGRRIVDESDATAVFAANDQMALGLLRAFREAGRNIPGDISVVGFDDIPEAGYFAPPLTTIRQNFPALGRLAVDLVRRAMDGQLAPSAPLIPAHLLQRSSTAPPPLSNTVSTATARLSTTVPVLPNCARRPSKPRA